MIVPGDIERLLILAPTWIGDTIMATGLYRAARTACPKANITLATSPGLIPLVRGMTWFDHVEPIRSKGLLGPMQAGRLLAHNRPQAIVLLPGSFRSALTAWHSHAPMRIGTRRDMRSWLLTHPLEPTDRSRPVSTVDHYMSIAHAAFGKAHVDDSLELQITEDDVAELDTLPLDASAGLLLLVPGANRADKRWPAARFAAVADALHQRHGLQPLVAGAPGERTLVQEVVNTMQAPGLNGVELGLGLGGLKAAAQRAALAITNDTGPRHIAAAVGTPLVSLFGPTDHRWTLLPSTREARLLADPFLPDTTMADRHPDQCAIERITVSDVLAAAEALLGDPNC